MHKLLRQYGEERFKEHDDKMETHMAFAEYYIALATKLAEVMQSGREEAGFEAMDKEIDNIRSRDLSQSFRQAVGVKEVIQYLEGVIDKDKMLEEIKKKTRHLAKHQFTWSKRFDLHVYQGADKDLPDQISQFVKAYSSS